jgi:hypothetical protein
MTIRYPHSNTYSRTRHNVSSKASVGQPGLPVRLWSPLGQTSEANRAAEFDGEVVLWLLLMEHLARDVWHGLPQTS